jgi:hydroxypyruvate isomerase
MGHHANNPYGSGDKAVRAIDRKREQERKIMLSAAYKFADELAMKLVQRLLDQHIIETTSESAIREVFANLLRNLQEVEDFDIQFKIAPLRQLAPNPNFMSLYLTQFIIEDLVNHAKIDDVFGDDVDVYKAVDSVLDKIRPTDL